MSNWFKIELITNSSKGVPMTTALTPNGHSPKPLQQKEKTAHSFQAISGQTLTKTIQVFLDTNLAEISDPSKKIDRQVEKIPSINELLKGIIENKEILLNETSRKSILDLESLFSTLTKLKDTPSSSSLLSFDLLDTLYSIAIKASKLKLSNIDSNFRVIILTHCNQLATHYQLNGGSNFKHFCARGDELLKNLTIRDPSY